MDYDIPSPATAARPTCCGKLANPRQGWPESRTWLSPLPSYGPMQAAVVTAANPQEATAELADGTSVSLTMEGMRWARPYRFIRRKARRRAKSRMWFRQDNEFRCRQNGDSWWLGQIPDVDSRAGMD
ncbi:hypothetical protein ACLK2H_19035 [Escherichia coli]